jgi:hypothetical protein
LTAIFFILKSRWDLSYEPEIIYSPDPLPGVCCLPQNLRGPGAANRLAFVSNGNSREADHHHEKCDGRRLPANQWRHIFGGQVAIKWNYVAVGTDTTWRLSFFCGQDIAHFILEGKRLGDSILLNGYWRKLVNTETGRVRLVVPYTAGARQLFSNTPQIARDSIRIEGVFGNGEEVPASRLVLTYDRKLYSAKPFQILAHRSGGRTSDLLPYSENSIGMIRFATQLGATGIEIDARMTSDNVPILYHDNTLNLRLIQKNGLVGDISNYSYQQLYSFVRLIDGQHIPTLREALNSVVYETNIQFVWLDTKYNGSLEPLRQLQAEFLQKAATAGRTLQIVIGLPGQDQLDRFRELPNYTNIPHSVNCRWMMCSPSMPVYGRPAGHWAYRIRKWPRCRQQAARHLSGHLMFRNTLRNSYGKETLMASFPITPPW